MAHSFLVRQVLILGGQVSTGRRVRPLGHVEWGHSTLEEMVQKVGRGGRQLEGEIRARSSPKMGIQCGGKREERCLTLCRGLIRVSPGNWYAEALTLKSSYLEITYIWPGMR